MDTCVVQRQMNDSLVLRRAGVAWCTVAVAGQAIFAAYVAGFYGPPAFRGDLAAWSKAMPHGYVRGDWVGNTAVGLHLLWAFAILATGAIQLIPAIRRRWPILHRWSGRVYVTAAIGASLAGIYMVLTRGTVGGTAQHVSILINGLLILLCAGIAWRHARARRFTDHRRWALRLFLVAGGVWFFRIGLMLWLIIHRAPVGFDPETFTGPFLTFLAFAQFLVPLAVLELYFWAERSPKAVHRFATAAALGVCMIGTLAGTAAATVGMWMPRLR